MTSTPRQPWKTTSNRSRTQEWRNKTSILLSCFYSNLVFMLKEILQIKTLIEDASKAMTWTYADYNKKLSFDYNRIGTDDLGNGVFIIFPKHDWPLTYIIKDINGQIKTINNDHNVNGTSINPWIYGLFDNDFLTCSVKSKYGYDIKPNDIVNIFLQNYRLTKHPK